MQLFCRSEANSFLADVVDVAELPDKGVSEDPTGTDWIESHTNYAVLVTHTRLKCFLDRFQISALEIIGVDPYRDDVVLVGDVVDLLVDRERNIGWLRITGNERLQTNSICNNMKLRFGQAVWDTRETDRSNAVVKLSADGVQDSVHHRRGPKDH